MLSVIWNKFFIDFFINNLLFYFILIYDYFFQKYLKYIWILLYKSINIFYIEFTWLMALKRKLKQISNYEEMFNGSSLLSSNKRNKKTEDVLASIITVLTNMFDMI